MMYEYLLKPILFRIDPENVHDFFTDTGETLGNFSLTRHLTDLVYGYHGSDISKIVDGIKYKTPVLLSAGFDYNARLSTILPFLAFGGEEVGSITSRPCEGNPKPRMTRLPKSGSIMVNKGLRNDGVDEIIKRLKSKPKIDDFIIGVSIARTNDKQSSTVDEGIEDYRTSFIKLNEAGVGDYYTINISCPNAFTGETFANPELLEKLIKSLETVPSDKPLYVKMPMNKSWDEFEKILNVLDKSSVDGVVICNLSKDYSNLDQGEIPNGRRGGLSGRPCASLSNELIKKTREKFKNRFTIIGSGGVMSPKDAIEKFEAGADLIQLITGMIFHGPSLIKNICREYACWSSGHKI